MNRSQRATLAGILASLICLAGLIGSSARETDSRRGDLKLEAGVVARQFASRVRGSLERHLIGLQQMANYWRFSQEVTQEEFYQFSAATLKLAPLCLRIGALDSALRVRWVFPPGPRHPPIAVDPMGHAEGADALLRAKDTRETTLSAPLDLLEGPQGFLLVSPIDRKDEFLGAVICPISASDFFASLTLPEVNQRYEEAVVDSGMPLFVSGSFGASGDTGLTMETRFSLGGRTWELRVRPRPEVIEAVLSSGRAAFWTLGLLLSLGIGSGVGWASYTASGAALRFRSQKKQLQKTRQQLDGATRQLLQAEKMTAIGELVAGVAHEINNPLTSIMGYSQLLMGKDLPPEVKRRLETIASESERMARIVKNLLTFARKHPPEKKYLGLNGIIEKTAELKAYHLRVSQIEVEKDLAADLPMTMLDFHQMQQVFLNLLNNAEQAMTEAGRGRAIRLTTRAAGDRIEARVEDDGPGIPAEIRARVFEPFFTTKKEGKGTGLGLSLCYGIVQEHGGTIRVESEPGKGTAFIVDLPVIHEHGEAGDEAPPDPLGSVPALRVLVIDDEPSVQDFLVDLLRSRGHSVDTASDVPEALRKIAVEGHDLIISDMKMPHGTGQDVYRAVLAKSPPLAKRILFTTGDGANPETHRFLEETGNSILLKPFTIEQIEAAIAGSVAN